MPQHDCTKRKRRLSHEFNHLAGLIKPRSHEATTTQGAEDLREAGDSRLDADLEKFRKLGPNDIQLSEPHEVIAHALPLPETEIFRLVHSNIPRSMQPLGTSRINCPSCSFIFGEVSPGEREGVHQAV